MSTIKKTSLRIVIIVAEVCIAWGVHEWAIQHLPIDYDEDDYLRAAQQYARIIRNRTWMQLPDVTINPEHPAMAKLVFGLAIANLPATEEIPARSVTDPAATFLPQPLLTRARRVSAAFGTAEVLLLALLNPLAGLLLALHTFTLKYTSHVMLEAQAAFTSALAAIAYERSLAHTQRRRHGWLVLSAVALGTTASSKYVYCIAGIAILVHWLFVMYRDRRTNAGFRLKMVLRMAGWCLLTMMVFLVTNPDLWSSPLARLQASVGYHIEFSHSNLVQFMDLPFYTPIVWLFEWVPYHPQLIPFGLDPLIAVLAVLGFKNLWKTRPLYAIWIGVALTFLFIWPTKWPQYILILTFPWALSAAKGFQTVIWPYIQRRIEQIKRRSVSIFRVDHIGE